ncbi:hypothetical protein PHAVU_007G059200 [Phaseolus vulgaris]|uniref:Uncharacterized protein n=1 Tax=Phaseolus vulgaris TaxID=3885 RepID=V7BBS8_PHAVU|nr:hypothetical protein PHAVU_007G059200g [Phaseolus vulgaris]ESW15274.1 hypothetical protein PHAVU_007G059200g [Phaseolus vulgaris]
MANKFFALLLVVCLVAAASVDAQLDLRTQCFNSCVAEDCGENPSLWCKFICNFRCASTEMENEVHGIWAEAPESSWAEAPQLSRKVQAQFEKL